MCVCVCVCVCVHTIKTNKKQCKKYDHFLSGRWPIRNIKQIENGISCKFIPKISFEMIPIVVVKIFTHFRLYM